MNIYYNDDLANSNIDINNLRKASDSERTVYDNEYIVLSLVLVGEKDDEKLNFNYDIDGIVSNLDKANLPKDVEIVTLLSQDGVDARGQVIHNNIVLNKDKITPIYIGIDASYLADKSIVSIELNTIKLHITLNKNGHMLRNKGADRPDSLVRLSWLNSTLFNNDKKSYIYDDIRIDGTRIYLRGKIVDLYKDGYIKNVLSFIDDGFRLSNRIEARLLDGGIKFGIDDNVVYEEMKIENVGANAHIISHGEGDTTLVTNECTVRYEGVFQYTITIEAKEDTILDIDEVNSFSKYASKYMSGLGNNGGRYKSFNFKWNDNYQDSLFVGAVNSGAVIKWMDNRDISPIDNIGTFTMPKCWSNNGEGGIDVLWEKERAKVIAYAGKVNMKKGEKKVFSFDVMLTPFHEVNFKKHFTTRYFENNRIRRAYTHNIVHDVETHDKNNFVLHNLNHKYPYMNYPLGDIENIRELVDTLKNKHVRTTLNFNMKELSQRAPECIAMNRMNDDIIYKDNGKAVISNKVSYSSGSHKGEIDTAVRTCSDGRYDNYYIECVNWLVKECDIKGIHLNDNILSRTTTERMRKVLDRYDANIDLRIPYKNKMSSTSVINNHMSMIPFVDSLLVGQGMNYKNMTPEALLVDVSGLMYGVTSEIIEGDPFLAMLFGMTNRCGMNVKNNDKIHKLWDKFGIEDSEIVGFWSEKALKAKDEGVKITYYKKDKKVLICMYNFNNYPAVFTVDYRDLKIDGIMKSYPISKLIMKQKFTPKTNIVIYNKCGVFILADLAE